MVSILLVDDDVRDVELALAALKKAAPEAQIDVASSGEEAVEYLRRHGDRQGGRSDLVVLDYKMPQLSGADVLRAVRSDPRACRSPIVVLSGSDSERDVEECYALGANAYVRKPHSYSGLSRALAGVVAFWSRWNEPAPTLCI